MIDVNMNSSGGVVLATSGKYCEEHIRVTPVLQSKTVTPTGAVQEVSADSGKVGLSSVKVNAVPTESKSVVPSESAQSIVPSSGKFLSKVDVAAIPSKYVNTETQAVVMNAKRWTVTLASNSPTAANPTAITMLSADSWIAENYNNERLSVLVAPITTVGGVSRPCGFAFATNYKIVDMANGVSYGGMTEASNSGQYPRAQYRNVPLSNEPTGNITNTFGVYVNSNGDVLYHRLQSTVLCAGTYIIMAWLA